MPLVSFGKESRQTIKERERIFKGRKEREFKIRRIDTKVI